MFLNLKLMLRLAKYKLDIDYILNYNIQEERLQTSILLHINISGRFSHVHVGPYFPLDLLMKTKVQIRYYVSCVELSLKKILYDDKFGQHYHFILLIPLQRLV